MVIDKILFQDVRPREGRKGIAWAKPVEGGFALYIFFNGEWQPQKVLDTLGTAIPYDDEDALHTLEEKILAEIGGLVPTGGASYTPTLQSAPTSSTTTYMRDEEEVPFEIGQLARVANASNPTGYDMWQVIDLVVPVEEESESTAVWQKVENFYADKEIVSIVCSTEVAGASVSGLEINVYYNDAEQPSATITTDSNGMASLLVPILTKYKLVFPVQQGCREIAPVVHVASVVQRSVEVEYEEDVVIYEPITVKLRGWYGRTSTALQGKTVHVTYDGVTTDYTTDSNGNISANIPLGKTYTVSVDAITGYYIIGGHSARTFTAESSARFIIYDYREGAVGVQIVCSDGTYWDFDDFKDEVTAGRKELSDAKFIHLASQELVDNNGVFSFDIDTFAERKYFGATPVVTRQWASQNVSFSTGTGNDYPLDGAPLNAKYHYDGQGASEHIRSFGDANGIDTPACDYAYNLVAQMGGNEYHGFEGAYGQWELLRGNVVFLDEIVSYVRPSATYNISDYTTQKWTSTQSNAYNAYLWTSSANNTNKNGQYVVVPFFAF